MSDGRRRILFVDDEQRILDGIRRQLRDKREQWDMHFALSAEEALCVMADRSFDALVSDMRMPGMSGSQLLHRARHAHPQAARVILSGHANPWAMLPHVASVHQYLQKPCEVGLLRRTLENLTANIALLPRQSLRIAGNRVLTLPPAREPFERLLNELGREETSCESLTRIIGSDPALAAKTMQFVTTSFFGTPRRMSSLSEAVTLLGVKALATLIVDAQLFAQTDEHERSQATVAELWQASVAIADAAATLARIDGAEAWVQEQARLAGLLCLVGRAILVTDPSAHYLLDITDSRSSELTLTSIERAHYGSTQDEVAAYALRLWAFPEEVVEAVAFQSAPSRLAAPVVNRILRYLHPARCVAPRQTGGLVDRPALDQEFMVQQKVKPLLSQYRKLAA